MTTHCMPHSVGRITRTHTTQGAVVEKGTPIVTLSLLDPVQINVAVSVNEDRKIETGVRAMAFPKDPIDPEDQPIAVPAIVYEKEALLIVIHEHFRST